MADSSMLDDEMRELLESFLVETNEILENLDQQLMDLESNPEDEDLLNSIFRSFHTVKGTSSFMGFEQITSITHKAEDVLNKLRRFELEATSHIVDVLLEAYDWMKTLVKKVEDNDPEPVDFTDTANKLVAILGGNENETASAASEKPSTVDTSNAVDSILGNDAFGEGEGDFSADELAMLEAAFAEVNSGLKSANSSTGDAQKKGAEAQAQPQTSPSPPPTPTPPQSPASQKGGDKKEADRGKRPTRNSSENTIRVDVERLESLMDLSGELVLGRNRLTQITQVLNQDQGKKADTNVDFFRELQETTSQINFITTELQAAIMKTRMVPIAKLFQKAPRMIRDLSKEFGKSIKLEMTGEDTELDRGIIEELTDPLVHMIRNSCDHGIETTAERESVGKPKQGTLCLEAEHEGNHIVIRIRDDGKGINRDAVLNKAIEKGVVSHDQAQQMTDREIYNLIFAPGFSTAQKVTSVSGRGVGMDVVRTNIQKLKGIIEIDSQWGKGSTFTIKLPLTLAIIQGLLVQLHDEVYAIPLSAVVEVVSTDLENVYSVNQEEVIRVRDDVFPLVRLGEVLGTQQPGSDLEDKYVVVVGLANSRVGLVVDELLGQKEVVIKSLGEYLGSVPGIAGSTILGDGRVIMIVDIEELIRNTKSKSATRNVSAHSVVTE